MADRSIEQFDRLGFSQQAGVCWGFLWRSVVATVGSALASSLVGFVLGFAIAQTGLPRATGSRLALGAGALVGTAFAAVFFWIYVRWLFRTDWSGYQLRLVRPDLARDTEVQVGR